jgi:ATP-dependent RNA helicase HelY
MHRPPHGGLASECAAWSSGKPLSRILDPDLTPGDFVRSIRQLIDLLRQIAQTTHNEQLRDTSLLAIDSLNRGVVAATQGGQS